MRVSDLAVKHGEARVQGVRMHYVEKGDGPLVVLLHGFPETWWSWRYQIPALAAAGYRVVAPDLRGYGDSDKQGPYDLETVAADVRGLIEQVGGGDKAFVVGHDWGGATAWLLASVAPELVERLAIVNCGHPVLFEKALRSKWSQVKRSWYMFFFQLPLLPELALRRGGGGGVKRTLLKWSEDHSNYSDEELQPFLDNVRQPGVASAMLGYYRAIAKGAVRGRKKALARYGQLPMETLIVWGMGDPALGFDDLVPGTERFAARLRVEKIEGAGHFPHSEQPEVVNRQLLAFFGERPAEAARKFPKSATYPLDG